MDNDEFYALCKANGYLQAYEMRPLNENKVEVEVSEEFFILTKNLLVQININIRNEMIVWKNHIVLSFKEMIQ